MLIKFKDFDTEAESLKLSNDNVLGFQSLVIDKIAFLNKNPVISSDMIQSSVFVNPDKIRMYVPKNHKEFLSFNIGVQFFEKEINMNLYVYFNEKGGFHHYMTACKLSNSYFIEKMGLTQLGSQYTHIEFDLDHRYLDGSHNYKLIKIGNFKVPNLKMPIISIEYSFNNNHEVHCKCFNVQSSSSGCSMPVHIFEKIDTENMFIGFLEHVMKENQACDKRFVDVSQLDFQKTEWIKIVHESFYKNMIGYNRQEFLNYLSVIEMSNY